MIMNIKRYFRHSTHYAAFAITVLAGLTLGSCAEEDLGNRNGSNKRVAVTFNVSSAQDDAQAAAAKAMPGMPVTRAAFCEQLGMMNLTPENLTSQKLAVQGAADLCLIETTIAGIDELPRQATKEAPTRANITTMPNLGHFSSYGYRGNSATLFSPTPDWFYNKDTNPNGTLVDPVYWAWDKNHFGRFYAVYPQVTNAYTKLTMSPESHASTPYVDFEVEPDVKTQKDLMTACSGVVQYVTPGAAPITNLKFRHALTAVRFKVGQNLSYSKHITKVEIIGAKSKGRYTLSTDETGAGAAWSNLSAPKTFTLGGDGTVNVSTSEAVNNIIMGNPGDNFVFYMIPQSLAGVQVKIYFDNSTTPAITANLAGTWKAGTTKTYALSQNTSTWQYELTVTSPAAVAYNATTTSDYTILSYREDPISHVKQPVKWKIVGYDADGDGTFDMSEKPAWLTGLSKTEGDGSTTAMSVEKGSGTVTTDFVDSLAIYNKKLRTATSRGTSGDPYDLSKHDFKGNLTALQNTANSYLISAPGWYKIPLVYGNAITNGVTNTGAYTCSESPIMQDYVMKKKYVWNPYTHKMEPEDDGWAQWDIVLHHFTAHNNTAISSPYINVHNASTPATQAYIVWSDQSGIVEASSLQVTGSGQDSWLNFHVPADKIKNGNAVIGIKNALGQVLWSWHLWFAHDDALDLIPVTNYSNVVYKFSKQPVGFAWRQWLETTYKHPRTVKARVEQEIGQTGNKQMSDITITQNAGKDKIPSVTLYQWGRKDAFPGVAEVSDGAISSFSNAGGISPGYAIGHPEQFLYHNNSVQNFSWINHSWCSWIYINLWSNKPTKGNYDRPIIKTIYDPSPVGFKVPPSGAFNGFSRTAGKVTNPADFNVEGGWDAGWHFNNKLSNPNKTIFLPITGYRTLPDGKLHYQEWGGYWSASTFLNYSSPSIWNSWSQCFNLTQSVVYPGNASQWANGLSIHPIKDE